MITNIHMMRSDSEVSPFAGLKLKGRNMFRPWFIFSHAPMSYSQAPRGFKITLQTLILIT